MTLQDHASRQQCTVVVEALADAARGLERLLGSGKDCWRPFESMKVKDPSRRAKRKGLDGRSAVP